MEEKFMWTQRHSTNVLVALFSAAVATAFLIACQQSTQPGPGPEPKTAASEVFVVFEGPWAIVADPKDANSILGIAPKTKSHRLLAVTPANTSLEAGIYDLAIPAHGAAGALDADKSFLRVTVDPKNVQHALDDKMERYAIRLPKPEAYRAETRYESRVGGTYPPDPSTQQNYVTAVSLVYRVTSKAGFSLAGTKDAGGAFNPLLLPLDTPMVRFAIDPAEANVADACSTHSRTAFRDLVRLLGVTLYVDFPESPADCHKRDPQLARSEKAQVMHGSPGEEPMGENLAPVLEAGIAGHFLAPRLDFLGRKIEGSLAAATYFFHSDSGACMAPIIFGGG
jgi:hypothetical protein